MEEAKQNQLTMQGLKEYLAFYQQNQVLKDKFVVSERVDFGGWNTSLLFDYRRKLFCLSELPDKTVFEGKHLKAFTVKEDHQPLFEGSARGLKSYTSTVPDRVRAMAPQISQYHMNKAMTSLMDRLDDGKENRSQPRQYFDLPELLQKFSVELQLDHPYWTVIRFQMDGPRFDREYPSVDDYLRSYQGCMEEFDRLVFAFKTVSFPGMLGQPGGAGKVGPDRVQKELVADTVEEIRKYKQLLDEGIISREEFDAKKRKLLGI